MGYFDFPPALALVAAARVARAANEFADTIPLLPRAVAACMAEDRAGVIAVVVVVVLCMVVWVGNVSLI